MILGLQTAHRSGMNTIDEPAVSAARMEVLSWLIEQQFGFYESNEELVTGFMRIVSEQTDLELRTQRNPSALVWEARWYHSHRQLTDFPKPFCAENVTDARLLACAAMLRLDLR